MSTFAAAVESNDHLISIWGAMALVRGGEVSTDDGVVRMWADSPFGFWNTVALDGQDIPAKTLGDQLARAAQSMRKGKQAGYLWVFEDLLSPAARQQLPSQVAEAGPDLAFTGYGMAGDVAVPDPVHPGVEFRRVGTEDDLITFGQINAWAYGMSEEADAGFVGVKPGPFTASTDIIEVAANGPGGHTARPHLTVDLLHALGRVIVDVPALLDRRVDPRTGLSLVWAAVHAGDAWGVRTSPSTSNMCPEPCFGSARAAQVAVSATTCIRAPSTSMNTALVWASRS